jgi:hypothetical protein
MAFLLLIPLIKISVNYNLQRNCRWRQHEHHGKQFFTTNYILRRAVREEIPFPVMSKRQKATKSLRIMCTQPKHTLTHIMSALFAFWGNVCHGTRRSVCTCIITINNNKGRRSSLFCTVYTQTPASR